MEEAAGTDGSAPPGWVEIGLVVKPYGVRGAVKVRLYNPDSDSLRSHRAQPTLALLLPDQRLEDAVEIVAWQGEGLALAVGAVRDRATADRLRGARLLMRRSDINLESNEFLYVELLGCRVQEAEQDYGVVVDVFCAGASDILVVHSEREERLIPLVDDWVVQVDTAARRIELRDADQWEATELESAGRSTRATTSDRSQSGAARQGRS
jgi:16S rRNA processing protein RimM